MTDLTDEEGGLPAVAAECFGVKIPSSPFLNDTRIRRMNEGRYEGEEIQGALSVVQPGDRVLELGAGLGVVGAVIAKNAKPEAVLSFEANPNLIPHIKDLHKINDLEDVMEVRHEVITAGPDQPDQVTFHLRTSFLGSSLIEHETRRTTAVEVPATSYDTVINAFRPDVLIMDIEGGELDLLRHANLRGIRAIVLEFHPDAYGTKGTRECKNILRGAMFKQHAETSTRFVWTCARDEAWAHPDASWPDPAGGWSERVQTCEQAVVKPNTTSSITNHSGVQSALGHDVPLSAHWRNRRRSTLPFVRPERLEALPGRWIWGGLLYNNFAHFIAESLGRLWAIDVIQGHVDGIVFTPRRPSPIKDITLNSFQQDVFAACGITIPIKVLDTPTQVAELVVPGQGFGLGDIIDGTPSFHRFREAHFAKNIAPDGGDRLYISRSKLAIDKGGLLGEAQIEERLSAEGYEIFHPEKHPINVQLARYKAAKKIIGCEGSAMHLMAFCAHPGQDIAMIMRRKTEATTMIQRHLGAFAGKKPLIVSSLKSVWDHPISQRGRMSLGEPDLPKVHAELLTGGFISQSEPWPELDPSEVKTVLEARMKKVA
ncbi:MAG: FkbM family methyltransferase [Pseudomonadota bacterium]